MHNPVMEPVLLNVCTAIFNKHVLDPNLPYTLPCVPAVHPQSPVGNGALCNSAYFSPWVFILSKTTRTPND